MKGPWESIAAGREKGYKTQKLEKVSRHIHFRVHASKRVKAVRELVNEVAGLLPYEKHLMDILKAGGNNTEKKMYKFAKKRGVIVQLGSHKRALAKRDAVKESYSKMRRAHHHH
ncbi:50S ribosomal protein L36 [Blastocystis sp. subtype 4]|uniref:50S ribosomal protein L36 n=1 Tax=Blastocystis sp. subtype 4 TaxID=944170 RepID=UPI0007116875|nr:50S ribosomal protein L36 [Blastocystis sp. subtype 4]KNB45403.1 50S ribosomal protein L36 [Blastocystis sp. subtype 4]|eukprot:XP_014528846.1 50S ribosomal protein L36 [Blastocystis sp. subtype 4]